MGHCNILVITIRMECCQMAVFAYNDEEMEKVISELGKISEGIAESVKKIGEEINKLQQEKIAAEKAYQQALESYRRAMASYNGKGTAPTPPSRSALNAIEAALNKAYTQLNNLKADAEALKDVQALMQDTQNLVRETEASVLAYINTKVLELKDFEVKKAVADAMGTGTTDSSYVKVGDKKYYTALYEDFTYKDYQKVAEVIGVPATLALMGANGMSTETGMALQGSVGNKRYDWAQVRHYMNDCTLIDKESGTTVKDLKGNGGIVTTGTVSTSDSTNKTALYRANQANGNQYTYTFTSEFNTAFDEKVADLLDNVQEGKFTDEEKAYLQQVIPYIVKGVGSSESSWSDGSQGYVGLTKGGLNANINTYLGYTFKESNYSTNISDYTQPIDGAEMSAAMLIHWAEHYKNNEGYDLNTALWKGQVSYCGGSSNAAYQLGMANDFYMQDCGNNLFEGTCANVVSNLSNYGVYSANGNTQVASVTIGADNVKVG